MEIEFGAQTDLGRARENNEDSFAVAPELNLFVLSDGMGGLAACRAIRADANVAIIMLTVRNTESAKVEALDAGADDFGAIGAEIEYHRQRGRFQFGELDTDAGQAEEDKEQLDQKRCVAHDFDIVKTLDHVTQRDFRHVL